MKYLHIYIFALYCIKVVLCAPNRRPPAFTQHIQRVTEKNYPCRLPQPRTVHLKELLAEEEWKHKDLDQAMNIYPALTILHSCMKSGCCNATNKMCLPEETDEVPLTFGISFGKKLDYIEVLATNHTSCKCQTTDR